MRPKSKLGNFLLLSSWNPLPNKETSQHTLMMSETYIHSSRFVFTNIRCDTASLTNILDVYLKILNFIRELMCLWSELTCLLSCNYFCKHNLSNKQLTWHNATTWWLGLDDYLQALQILGLLIVFEDIIDQIGREEKSLAPQNLKLALLKKY